LVHRYAGTLGSPYLEVTSCEFGELGMLDEDGGEEVSEKAEELSGRLLLLLLPLDIEAWVASLQLRLLDGPSPSSPTISTPG